MSMSIRSISKRRFLISLVASATLFGSLGAQARGGRFNGEVRAVDDGDTLHVRDRSGKVRRVRLAYVDAPEHDQPWGREAGENLKRLALGASVAVEWRERDQHGRYVGVAWVSSPDMPCAGRADCPHNLDLGHAQITAGLAWWYRAYAKRQDPQAQGLYELSEQQARRRRIGLWRDASPIPPWVWRSGWRG